MYGLIRFKALPALSLALGLLLVYPLKSQAFERILCDKGGVVEDFQLLRRADGSPSDTAWATNMESGLFRGVYDTEENLWNDWKEFYPGLYMLGIEAVQDYESNASHEYVMFTTDHNGIWYAKDPTISGASGVSEPYWGNWVRPNGEPAYPDAWNDAWVADAAFYYSDDQQNPHYYVDGDKRPETQFYVSLDKEITTGGNYKAGIYKWDVTLNPDNFFRVDGDQFTPNRFFHHFWRDLGDQNVLYSIDETENNGGLWKFHGSYASGTFTLVTGIVSGTVLSIPGFEQWDEGGTVHTYMLVKWTENGNTHYSVYHSRNLAAETDVTFDSLTTVDDSLMEEDQTLLDETWYTNTFGKIIGRPDGEDGHYIWLGTADGVVYLYCPNPGNPVQVNGSGSTQLKCYHIWRFVPDQYHLGNNLMNAFVGTHKHGLYYANITEAGAYTYTQLEDYGYVGGDTRRSGQLRILPGDPASNPKIILGYYNRGLFEKELNEAGWNEWGLDNTDPTYDLAWRKACYAIETFDNHVYYGSGHQDAYINGQDYEFGGLYKVDMDGSNICSEDNFHPGGYTNCHRFSVSTLARASSGAQSCLYLTTGFAGGDEEYNVGCPTTNHYICWYHLVGSSWQWDDIYAATVANYAHTGFTDLHPNPYNPMNSFFVSTGLTLGLNVNWHGKVQRFDGPFYPGPVSGPTASYEFSGHDKTTVYDIAVESTGSDDAPIYASVTWPDGGMLYKLTRSGSTYTPAALYDANSIFADRTYSNNALPVPGPIELFKTDGQTRIAVVLSGPITLNGEPVMAQDLFIATYNGFNWDWERVTQYPFQSENNFQAYYTSLRIDQGSGNDMFLAAQGSVIHVDNNLTASALSANNWHWISFNSADPEDSLGYLFANVDSLQQIRDQYGHRFMPHATPPVDSVYVWNWLKGYGIRCSAAETLEVCGPQIPRDSLMILEPAPNDSAWIYNYIAYLPADTMSTSCAFLADSDTVIIVKEDGGDFWRPSDDDNGFNMVPGEGYQVGVSDTLHYRYPAVSIPASLGPSGPEHKGSPQGQITSLDPEHFQFTKYTGDFYAIYISDLLVNGNPPETGDEVAVFTPENLCAGAGVYEGSFPVKIAAWKDDPCTEATDGYTSGQTLSFKFWDASAGVEAPLEMDGITVQNMNPGSGYNYTRFDQGYYAQHTLSGSYVLPGVYALSQNYPNPFNPTTTIRYDLPFESKVTLEVFDIMGRLVTTLAEGKQSAGFRAVHWSGTNGQGAELASGVYFYRLKAEATNPGLGQKGHFEKTHKMVLLK